MEPSPEGGMGGLERGLGVVAEEEGLGAGLYSVVWFGIAAGAETTPSLSFSNNKVDLLSKQPPTSRC